MSAEGNHEFTFYYEYVEAMPYKVQYLDSNGNKVFDEKTVWDNGLSVVTETFRRANKMMPDAYQKRLVLSAEGTDADGDGVLEDQYPKYCAPNGTKCALHHGTDNVCSFRSEEHTSELQSR